MATAAQIKANQDNAKRSTGPRTVNGKARVCCNAIKHGRRAARLVPGLPNEDATMFQQRIGRYLLDWQPRDEAERDLVCQAARLSLMIERAERMEIAHMGGRIQAAAQERVQKIRLPRLEEVQELGRRLLYIAALDEIKVLGHPLWADDPRLLVAKLEATVDGCRWLLARWAEFRHLLDGRTHWELPVLLRFIRLQGKLVDESVFDPALNAIFLAWDVLIPKFAKHYWEKFRENRSQADTACLYALRGARSHLAPATRPRRGKRSTRLSNSTSIGSRHCSCGTRTWKRKRPTTGSIAQHLISARNSSGTGAICRPRHESCIRHWKRCGRCRSRIGGMANAR